MPASQTCHTGAVDVTPAPSAVWTAMRTGVRTDGHPGWASPARRASAVASAYSCAILLALCAVVPSALAQEPPATPEPAPEVEPAAEPAAPTPPATEEPAPAPEPPAPKPEPAAPTPAPSAPLGPSTGVDPYGSDRERTTIAISRPKRKVRRFIEGELANVGAMGLVPWENRFGTTIGVERVGDIYYGAVTPQINYSTELAARQFSMSFGVPIRIELNDTRPGRGWNNAGTIRKQDWDEVSDYATLIRGIQYGGKEDRIYLDINAFKASSLGHGTLLKRYNPNLNLNSRRVSAQLDAFGDYGGGELFVNNITGPSVIGALAFIKPLSVINRDNYVLRSFSIGLTGVVDLDAPLRNKLDYDDVDDDGARATEYLVDQDNFQPQYHATKVAAVGLDAEVKLVDTRTTDWKTYVDYSILAGGLPTNPKDPRWENEANKTGIRGIQSKGLTWGNLFRLNLGSTTVHALRLRTEVRRYDRNYLPSYFDVMYEVQRVQYRLGDRRLNPNGTKVQEILGRDPKADGGASVMGLYFEGSWKVGDAFAIAVALETNDRTPDDNLFIHLELPAWKRLQFLATLHRRSANGLNKLFDTQATTRDILIVKSRLRISDSFHINMEALTPYGIGPDSFFANTVDFNLNAEFGFSYGKRKR
jgi:hypothetical protein